VRHQFLNADYLPTCDPHLATVCLYPEVASIHALATRCCNLENRGERNAREKKGVSGDGKIKAIPFSPSLSQQFSTHFGRVKQALPPAVLPDALDERGHGGAHPRQGIGSGVVERRGLNWRRRRGRRGRGGDPSGGAVVVGRFGRGRRGAKRCCCFKNNLRSGLQRLRGSICRLSRRGGRGAHPERGKQREAERDQKEREAQPLEFFGWSK